MIEVKTPGKLYIAGEYSVVAPGHKAIAISINKFIYIKIKKSETKGSVKSYSNIKMIYHRNENGIVVDQMDDRFEYIFSAINIVENYLKSKGYDLDYYDIEVRSELESQDGLKYGLGSSAAVVVGIVKAVLHYYGYKYEKIELFKLSALASILINHETSCGDIASAVYEGIIKYTSFSRIEILNKYKNSDIQNIIQDKWNHLSIEEIELNPDINILVGWTKSPASSTNLVVKSIRNKKKHLDFYNKFLDESDKCVEEFYKSYLNGDFEGIKNSISKNRNLLLEYSKYFEIEIESKNLTKLIEISTKYGLASKTSGAGGGDCGISIYSNTDKISFLEKEWEENGIIRLNLDIYGGKYE